MDENPYKKKRKIENIIFWISILSLLLYLIFRTEIVSDPHLCLSCSKPEDCEKVCLKYCLTRITDSITSVGYENNSNIYCSCTCNSNLHKFVDRFL